MIDFFKVNSIDTPYAPIVKIAIGGKTVWEQPPSNSTRLRLYGFDGELIGIYYSPCPTPKIQVHSGGGVGTAVVFGDLTPDDEYDFGFETGEYKSMDGHNLFCSVDHIASGLSRTQGGPIAIPYGQITALAYGQAHTYYLIR